LFVRGKVTVERGIVVLDLRVKDASGEDRGERRVRFDDRTCEEIEAPAALVLAMMIGVARARGADASNEEPPGAIAEPAPLDERIAPDRAPVRERPPRPRPAPVAEPTRVSAPMTLGLSAVASHGGLPNVGLGGALRWTATFWGSVMLGLEGTFETTWAVPAANGEATFRRIDGGVLIGATAVRSRWLEIIPLVEARGGVLTGEVSGLPSAHDATSVVGAFGAGALGRIPLGRALRLEVLPGIRLPLARDEFQVRRADELIRVFRPDAVEARLSFGFAWELR
jgi:hypothetical protein